MVLCPQTCFLSLLPSGPDWLGAYSTFPRGSLQACQFFLPPFCPAPARPPSKLPILCPQKGTFSILPCYQKAQSPGEAPWKSLSCFSLHSSCHPPDLLGSQKGLHWLPHRPEAGLTRAPWPRRAREGSRAQAPGCKGPGCLGAGSPAFRLPGPPFGRPVRRSLGHHHHHHHHHHMQPACV